MFTSAVVFSLQVFCCTFAHTIVKISFYASLNCYQLFSHWRWASLHRAFGSHGVVFPASPQTLPVFVPGPSGRRSRSSEYSECRKSIKVFRYYKWPTSVLYCKAIVNIYRFETYTIRTNHLSVGLWFSFVQFLSEIHLQFITFPMGFNSEDWINLLELFWLCVWGHCHGETSSSNLLWNLLPRHSIHV